MQQQANILEKLPTNNIPLYAITTVVAQIKNQVWHSDGLVEYKNRKLWHQESRQG